MTLHEAVEKGISRVRLPQWDHKEDYLLIDVFRDPLDETKFACGPWLHLYSPLNVVVGNKNPVDMMFNVLNWDEDGWEEYTVQPVSDQVETLP